MQTLLSYNVLFSHRMLNLTLFHCFAFYLAKKTCSSPLALLTTELCIHFRVIHVYTGTSRTQLLTSLAGEVSIKVIIT